MEINRVRVRQAGAVEMLRELRQVPCTDCGGRFEPYQMDFDHRDPSTKLFNVTAGRAMLMSDEKLLAEVAKCDIVCVELPSRSGRSDRRIEVRRPNRSMQVASSRARRSSTGETTQRLLDELREVPCMDCGQPVSDRAPWILITGIRQPNAAVSRDSIGRTSHGAPFCEEVAKCDIVCANCHRMRTYRRREALTERE